MEKENEKEILSYTFVLHTVRIKLNLSLNDYCIADCIYNLSNNPKSKIQGWCWASKKTLGELIGISGTSVYSILNKLLKLKIVEKDNDTKYLRTTQLWYDNVILKRIDLRKLSHTKESLVGGTRKLSQTLKKVKTIRIDKKKNILSANADGEFNSSFYIKEMIKNKQKHISIIGRYFKAVQMNFPFVEAAQKEVKRHLRAATMLSKYDEERVSKTAIYVKSKFPDNWNLDTILKYINKIK